MKVFALVRFHQYHGEFGETKLYLTSKEAHDQMEFEYLDWLQCGWESFDQYISFDNAFIDFNEPVVWWEIQEIDFPGDEDA